LAGGRSQENSPVLDGDARISRLACLYRGSSPVPSALYGIEYRSRQVLTLRVSYLTLLAQHVDTNYFENRRYLT
jgi:hypothetical protein